MSDTTDKVVLALAEHVEEHDKQIGELLEMIQSLQRNLTNAFKEAGYDFQKIARIESSRRRDAIQNNTDVQLDPEEFNPDFQDEVARKILASQPLTSNKDLIEIQQEQHEEAGASQDGEVKVSRDGLTKASNKGRKE